MQINHGERKNRTELYRKLEGMKSRCYNEKHISYHNYGGRGIGICDEWRENYLNFKKWATANGFKPGLEIDRIDNDKGYSPENCRFITSKENNRNTSKQKLTHQKVKDIKKMKHLWKNKKITQAAIAKKYGVTRYTICDIFAGKRWSDIEP